MAVDVSFALDNFEREAARRLADAALAQSEARFRGIIETAHDAFILVGAHGELLDTNNAASELSGFSREQLLAMTLRDLEAAESDEEIARTTAKVIATGHARFERTWRHKDGRLLNIEISSTYVGKERGGYFYSFVHNITERKQAERALREGAERFRAMLEQNISAMVIVEDGVLTYANRRAGEILGYSAEELIGRAMLDLVVAPERENIAAAMRQLLSGERKTVEWNFGALRKDGSVADIGAHAILAMLQGKKAILGIAQDIGEHKKAQAEIDRYVGRLEHAMQSTLEAVSLMVELRDPYPAGHERRVGELAAAIGAEMGLPDDTVKGLRLAGYVHDIGKISVPAEILSKPARLTPIEFELIKGHCRSGYDVLKDVDFPWPVAQVILQHHERLDGSGYPGKLKGSEIILEARIMAVADVVEAMSSHRPYRPGMGLDAALEEVESNSGRIYDAQAVAACLSLFRDKGYALPE
jgi:PAS domain S-box-containing protein